MRRMRNANLKIKNPTINTLIVKQPDSKLQLYLAGIAVFAGLVYYDLPVFLKSIGYNRNFRDKKIDFNILNNAEILELANKTGTIQPESLLTTLSTKTIDDNELKPNRLNSFNNSEKLIINQIKAKKIDLFIKFADIRELINANNISRATLNQDLISEINNIKPVLTKADINDAELNKNLNLYIDNYQNLIDSIKKQFNEEDKNLKEKTDINQLINNKLSDLVNKDLFTQFPLLNELDTKIKNIYTNLSDNSEELNNLYLKDKDVNQEIKRLLDIESNYYYKKEEINKIQIKDPIDNSKTLNVNQIIQPRIDLKDYALINNSLIGILKYLYIKILESKNQSNLITYNNAFHSYLHSIHNFNSKNSFIKKLAHDNLDSNIIISKQIISNEFDNLRNQIFFDILYKQTQEYTNKNSFSIFNFYSSYILSRVSRFWLYIIKPFYLNDSKINLLKDVKILSNIKQDIIEEKYEDAYNKLSLLDNYNSTNLEYISNRLKMIVKPKISIDLLTINLKI